MKHKVLFVVSIISVFALVISSVSFTITNAQLETAYDEYISIKEKNKEIVTDVDSEINMLKQQRDIANQDYKRIVSAQRVYQIAADYYSIRYVFNGSPRDNKQKIINRIKEFTTKEFRDDLKIKLSKSGGNGNVSEDFSHNCFVESLFSSDIYQKNNDNLGKKAKINMLDVYARIRLNDKYDAISVLTFTLIQNEWRISDERIVATRFENL